MSWTLQGVQLPKHAYKQFGLDQTVHSMEAAATSALQYA
jgi:hypothetical protein